MTRMVSNEPGQPQNNNNIIIVGGGSNNDAVTSLNSSTRPSIMTTPATSSNSNAVAYYAGNTPTSSNPVGAQLNNPVAAAVNPSTFGWSGYPLPPTPNHFAEAQMRMSAPWTFDAASAITTHNRTAAPPFYYQQHSPMLQHQSSLGTSMVEARKVKDQAKDEDISRKRKYEAADQPTTTGIDLALQGQAPKGTDTISTRAIWPRHNDPPLFSQNSSHYMSPGTADMQGGMGGSRRVSLLDHPHFTSPRGVAGMSPGAPLYLYPPPPPSAPAVHSYPSSPNPRASLDDTLMQQQQRQWQQLQQLQQWQRQQLQQQLQSSPQAAAASPTSRQHDVLRTSSFDLPGYRRDMMPDFSPKKKKKSNPEKRKDNVMSSPKSIHNSDEDYVKALALLQKRYDEASTLSTGKDGDDNDIVLIEEGDRGLLTDYFYFIMLQLKACRLTEADRTARGDKRRDVPIGFGGLQCLHCAPCPAPRKFFWSDVNRLANSFACIPDHVLTCRMCPKEVIDALLVLKDRHKSQMQSIPRGSQKHCLRKIWKKLHADDNINTESAT